MPWIFAAACLVLLFLAVDEANGLRMRLVDQQIAMNEYAAKLAVAHRALAAIDEERRGCELPARLSCSVHRDRANGHPIILFHN